MMNIKSVLIALALFVTFQVNAQLDGPPSPPGGTDWCMVAPCLGGCPASSGSSCQQKSLNSDGDVLTKPQPSIYMIDSLLNNTSSSKYDRQIR